jgi:hypothetical protein
MASLTIDLPDDLARRLEGIAFSQHKSLQQLALEQLSTLAEADSEFPVGSSSRVLQAVESAPHPPPADVDDLDAAIASARLPIRAYDPFTPTAP